MSERSALLLTMFGTSFALILFELLLTRIFGVVLFATFAHLALALALLGISAGALAQHLWPWLVPSEQMGRRLGWLLVYLAATSSFATLAAIRLPITVQFAEPPVTYGERSSVLGTLIDPVWFPLLLPILAVPFAIGGLVFAGVFQHRRERIGELYAADLIGGAAAAVAFVPLLMAVPAPDAVAVVALAALIPAAALSRAAGERALAAVAWLGIVGCGAALVPAMAGNELLPIRYAAGYSEQNVKWLRWTPLTRLAIHEDARGVYMLLDNTSASEIVTTPERREARSQEANRAAVYHLHEPGGRVAILASSAGPEVAVAQHAGFHDIDAIDIASEIADAVEHRYPDALVNPFRSPRVRRVKLDGRAAILHANEPYRIIQMVHANLHSSAGLLANAWSPALLETREAFHTYFDHLEPDGTLSFAHGARTPDVARAIAAALRERGVADPAGHIALVRGRSNVVLAKQRPFTHAERASLRRHLKRIGRHELVGQPVLGGRSLTDDHPYFDTPQRVIRGIVRGMRPSVEDQVDPGEVIYRTIALQGLFVAIAGLVLALPALRRGDGSRRWPVLLYVSCLGYGYLAVETVLIHELVLFVGHPVYAITVVILSMLASSGLGALVAQRLSREGLVVTLRLILGGVLVLGALQAWVVPGILHTLALGTPLGIRAGGTLLLLAPLGVLMGMPFPIGIRLLSDRQGHLVPWAWALNGWMSVVATLGTVVLARSYGYSTAFSVALISYAIAMAATLFQWD